MNDTDSIERLARLMTFSWGKGRVEKEGEGKNIQVILLKLCFI